MLRLGVDLQAIGAGRAGAGCLHLAARPIDRPFPAGDIVQAARILAEAGERDLFRVFALHLDDNLPTGAEYAQLVDLARGYGDQDTSMKIVRTAAQKGFILPERGYPLRANPPQGGLETAVIFGITRQESGFDPLVRSGVGARGMMQLMPTTAQVVARGMGVDLTGRNYLDVIAPEAKAPYLKLVDAQIGQPCGRRSVLRSRNATGLIARTEALTLPMFYASSGHFMIISYFEQIETVGYEKGGYKILQFEKTEWLDIGAGVPDWI